MMQKLRSVMLPLAMLAGILFSGFFSMLMPVTPYLIFGMLFVTFCRIAPEQMKFSPMHLVLLAIQVFCSIGIYLLVRPFNEIAAQALLICILAPTATASVVIAGMLGANLATMATFTLLSNVAVACIAPVLFSLIGPHSELDFLHSFWLILRRVMPLLVLPFVGAFLLRKLAPRIHAGIYKIQILSFYLWSLSLMIVTGQTVEFIKHSPAGDFRLEIYIALTALVICLCQFIVGRFIGRKYGDTVAGGQSLGQKNTVLAIWMAQTYLEPLSSIGPASYVLWQNLVNSYQLWRKRRSGI